LYDAEIGVERACAHTGAQALAALAFGYGSESPCILICRMQRGPVGKGLSLN